VDQVARVNLAVTAVHAMHDKIISAISCIAAALRPSPYAHVALSSVSIEASGTGPEPKRIDVRLDELEEISEAQCCWHPLFPNAVIAKGFPVRDRVQGTGLEISFANMALMSQSLRIVEYDRGLVLEGLRLFLIPVRLLPDGSVQWHLEYKRIGGRQKPRKIFEVMREDHLVNRYRSLDVKDLVQRRCFLGWVDSVEVLIGTKEFSANTLDWSGAKSGQVTGHLKSHGITTGTEGLGIFGLTANRTYLPVAVASRIIVQQNKEISDTLDDESDAHAMVYDTETKTAYVLPLADVILFVAHRVLKRRNSEVLDGDHVTTLDFASKDVSALEILRRSLGLDIRRRDSRRNSDIKCFGDLVKELWNSLDMIEDQLALKEQELAAIGKSGQKFLRGVEFRHFEGTRSTMGIVRARVNEPWVHLVISEPTMPVLFCQGLGRPIVPTRTSLLCTFWFSVPPGRNYMVATGAAVSRRLERHVHNKDGARLSEKVEWKVREGSGSLIDCHNIAESKAVYHEQQLKFVSKANFNPKIQGLVSNCSRGALVFGSSRTWQGCTRKLDKAIRSHSQVPFLQNSFRYLAQHSNSNIRALPDTTEGSSDTSIESLTSSTMDYISYAPSLAVSNLSRGDDDPQEEDLSPCLVSNPTNSNLSQEGYVTNSNAKITSKTAKGNGSLDRIPRSLKKMKKSDHLNVIQGEAGLEVE